VAQALDKPTLIKAMFLSLLKAHESKLLTLFRIDNLRRFEVAKDPVVDFQKMHR
jgi:hypothetical protein